jgi:hypothetical protein
MMMFCAVVVAAIPHSKEGSDLDPMVFGTKF